MRTELFSILQLEKGMSALEVLQLKAPCVSNQLYTIKSIKLKAKKQKLRPYVLGQLQTQHQYAAKYSQLSQVMVSRAYF